MKNIVKLGEKQYGLKFHFAEAKYDHPQGGKTWYNKPLDVSQIGRIPYDEALVSDALDDIAKIVETNQIHVLLGFSQGGNVVDTFLQYRPHASIRCAVILSGYSLVDAARKTIDGVSLLNIVSEADTIVPHILAPQDYKSVQTIRHDKGHKIPTQNGFIREMCSFMRQIK